jgi:hypothetical protein
MHTAGFSMKKKEKKRNEGTLQRKQKKRKEMEWNGHFAPFRP